MRCSVHILFPLLMLLGCLLSGLCPLAEYNSQQHVHTSRPADRADKQSLAHDKPNKLSGGIIFLISLFVETKL